MSLEELRAEVAQLRQQVGELSLVKDHIEICEPLDLGLDGSPPTLF
jgi:hypothetical protein